MPTARPRGYMEGIKNHIVSSHFEAAGIAIAQQRCLGVEHRRLLAGTS